MDPSLLRQRQAFQARAMKQPAVEAKRKHNTEDSRPSKKSRQIQKPKPPKTAFDYKTSVGSQQKFAVLAKIVKHMKQRHQEGDMHPLTLEEMLDETNQLDASPVMRRWLATESLINNPKIESVEGDKFVYKPKYNIRSRKALLRFLDKNDQDGLGGILMEDVEESLPRAAKVLKILGDRILYVTRPDKKQVLFYNDKGYEFKVDEELVKTWRSVGVEGMDEKKIDEYLQRQGITSMQDIGGKKVMPALKRKKGGNKKRQFKTHNDHLDGVLQDYSQGKKS